MNYNEILELHVEEEDCTIREYFHKLLTTLWREGEGFSGKRPFGNSGWEHDLYEPLVKSGVVKGEVDEDGYLQEVDTKAADALVFKLIDHIFKETK